MDLTFFKDLGQIFAWTAAGAFFAYRFYTGWFHPDLSLELICERRPAPTETRSTPMDYLTVVANVKKGPNMTIRLVDLQARVTFGDQSAARRFEGVQRRCFKSERTKGGSDVPEVDWDGTPSTGPVYLSLAPGDETQFATLFKVPGDAVCVVKAMLFARKFIPGVSQRGNESVNPHQWGASQVSLPSLRDPEVQGN